MGNNDRTRSTRRPRRQFRGLTRRRRNTTRTQKPQPQYEYTEEYDLFHSPFFPYYRKKDADSQTCLLNRAFDSSSFLRLSSDHRPSVLLSPTLRFTRVCFARLSRPAEN